MNKQTRKATELPWRSTRQSLPGHQNAASLEKRKKGEPKLASSAYADPLKPRDKALTTQYLARQGLLVHLMVIEDGADPVKTLVSIGRGGGGKTSFVALMTKYFIENGDCPLLLVDVDPDQNLGETVGISLREEGKKSISELVIDAFINGGGTTVGVPPSERIESRIWEEGLLEGELFDFMAVGPKWVEGCYCLPDASLKRALERLTKAYRYVLIDSPAGLEHLNRKITSQVDDLFDIIDPSKKSFEHVKRAYRIAEEVGIDFKNFYIIGGYRFPEALEPEVEEKTGLKYLGKISYDKKVEDYCFTGRSLLELPQSSPAFHSAREILVKAGYT